MISTTISALSNRDPRLARRAREQTSAPALPAVAIVGYGLLTPLGSSSGETWNALIGGHAIEHHAAVPRSFPGNEPRVCALAAAAAREAVDAAGWTQDELTEDASAIVVGTSKGPVESWLTAPPPHIADSPCVVAGEEHRFGLAAVCAAVAGELRAGAGPRLTLSAACTSGLHALCRAWMMIRCGQVRRAVVVAAECSLHPLFLGSFQRLGVLPRNGVGCRPFDEGRDGFLMSEAAAAVCLIARESGNTASPSSGKSGEVFVDRFGLGGDATHLTGSDPQGRLLRHLIRSVAGTSPIDLVHAHGTGTATNDPVELAAIDATVQGRPNVFSHKAALGHSLGAAGLVSVVLNCMMHERGLIPSNVRTSRPLPAQHVMLAQEPVVRQVRRSIAIAAGFGGPTAVVGLKS